MKGSWELLERHGGRAVSPADDGYPRRLLDVRPPPPVVFVVGPWVHDGPVVAVVGAREATEDGLDVARELGFGLARAGAAVVSGLARGIDAAAHEGALEAGGRSGAVLGTGIDRCYPRANASLQRRLARSLGLLSEILPGAASTRSTFASRNRLVAALSDVVVVVQGRAKSGSLLTAQEAVLIGRPVAALPWDSREPLAEAPHHLIREGLATLVRGVEDLLELLPSGNAGHRGATRRVGPMLPAGVAAPRPDEPRLPADLGGSEARLYRALRERPLPLDRLAEASALPPAELLAALVTLELLGLARRTPGGLAQRPRRR